MSLFYAKHFLDKNDFQSVQRVLKKNNLTQGEYVEKFEKNLKTYFKSNYSIVLTNGTAALHLAIKSLNLKEKSKIITSPITFISTVSSIIMNNHIPDFVDICENNYTLDPNKLEHKIKKSKKISAVIAVDYAGNPCDWNALKYLSKKYNFYLINDNCHALGAKLNGNKGYAVSFADLVTQSYHPAKNFTTGEGGSVLTNNKKLADRIRLLRSHSMIKDPKMIKKFGQWNYFVNEVGYNYRLTDIQCALGISQLKKLDSFVKKRQDISKIYNNEFLGLPNIQIPKKLKSNYHSYHLYPLLIDFKNLKINKKSFFEILSKKKINLQVHYIPVYKQSFLKKFRFEDKNFPVSEKFYSQEVSLPIYYSLKKREQLIVIQNIIQILKKYAK
ncbi:DegT/DnrJ/EryC1/StrS family aminotransferase [Candidatus Pelagibacter sp.]|nr:DegT/DnrJ/EryC1/StrS family aminotransferase [Candidatus Pelagibacter sp.]